MSGSDPHDGTGRILLSAAMPGVAFTIVDGTFQAVARGVGRLDVELPHGIYEISTRAGGSVETRLVSLEPGETWKRLDVTAGVYAAAPLPGSRTASASHAAAVDAASRRVAAATGPAAGMVLVVRRTDPGAAVLHHEQLTLLDRSLEPVPGWPAEWEADPDAGVATIGGRLEPGPYVLRLVREQGPPLDQALWLSEGWQTLVFCPNGTDNADLEDAVVHLTRVDEPFPGAHAGVAAAVEIATSGLRQGLPLVNEDLLQVLRDSDFANPMLGITGAHALLLRDPTDLDGLCRVVNELRALLPDHPDVLALANHPACRSGKVPSVSWPPMLAASYDKLLLPADQLDTEVILDGSPAERVAGYVVQRGPWLCWEATPAVLRPAPLPVPPGEPTQLPSATTEGATRRVQRHVLEVANLTGNTQHQVAGALGAQELARRLQLPLQTVQAVMAELGWDKVFIGTPRTVVDDDVPEEDLEPVPPGESPFAEPEPVVPEDDVPPAGPVVEEPPEPEPVPPDHDHRWWWLVAGMVTAAVLVFAGARVFGGGVTISVPRPPDLFARAASSSQDLTVKLAGNGGAQPVGVRVDGIGFAADGSRCGSVGADGSCAVRVTYRPTERKVAHLATLVLSTDGADELRVPLYGAANPAEGDVRVKWSRLRNPRAGETITPRIDLINVRRGRVQTVLAITVPPGFDLGTFSDGCDTRQARVVFCWIGLDEHHSVWPVTVPLVARAGAGGTLQVTAQLSVDPRNPDRNPRDNTARADVQVTTG